MNKYDLAYLSGLLKLIQAMMNNHQLANLNEMLKQASMGIYLYLNIISQGLLEIYELADEVNLGIDDYL